MRTCVRNAKSNLETLPIRIIVKLRNPRGNRFIFKTSEYDLNLRKLKTKSDRKSSILRSYWTKICTRVILSILQTFLHFLKAKCINNCLNSTENNFLREREKINFKVQRFWGSTGKISSSVSFHQNFQVFHAKFNIRFRRLVLLEMNCFEKIFKRALQKFAIHCK